MRARCCWHNRLVTGGAVTLQLTRGAQVHASADRLRLITFDADGTLYADGCHMQQDNKMIDAMIDLMAKRVYVAIVTAAGYPGQPNMFEGRIRGLLDAFKDRGLSQDVTDRFLVLGGECNYLLRCAPCVRCAAAACFCSGGLPTPSVWSAASYAARTQVQPRQTEARVRAGRGLEDGGDAGVAARGHRGRPRQGAGLPRGGGGQSTSEVSGTHNATRLSCSGCI